MLGPWCTRPAGLVGTLVVQAGAGSAAAGGSAAPGRVCTYSSLGRSIARCSAPVCGPTRAASCPVHGMCGTTRPLPITAQSASDRARSSPERCTVGDVRRGARNGWQLHRATCSSRLQLQGSARRFTAHLRARRRAVWPNGLRLHGPPHATAAGASGQRRAHRPGCLPCPDRRPRGRDGNCLRVRRPRSAPAPRRHRRRHRHLHRRRCP